MLMSHMESPNVPNVRFGEPGDVSAAFNYGFSDAMMNNLWVYDFNMLEESQNHIIPGLPVQESDSAEYAVSNPTLCSSRLLVNMEHNRKNDDPNTIKVSDFIQSKVTRKGIKGPRSKRCKRTAFEGPWKQKGQNLYGSVDNQWSDISEPTFKKQKGQNLYGSVDSDLSEPTFKKQKGQNLYGSVGSDLSEPTFKKQKGQNLESNDLVSESVNVNGVGRWLEDMGFGRYAGMFEMHEVDEDALPLLTLDDLKEMGVLAVGSRRKLYAAICGLKGK